MKNSWLVWFFVVGVVITVLVAFNYQSEKSAVPLTEIFPDEESYPVDIEYEFIESEQRMSSTPKTISSTTETEQAQAPQEQAKQVTVKAPEPSAVKTEPLQHAAAVKSQPEPTPAETAKADTKTQTQSNSAAYTIQVASFRKQQMADTLVKELKGKNLAGFIKERQLGEKGTWYRVYVGQYESKSQAEENLAVIKRDYMDSFILSPKK